MGIRLINFGSTLYRKAFLGSLFLRRLFVDVGFFEHKGKTQILFGETMKTMVKLRILDGRWISEWF